MFCGDNDSDNYETDKMGWDMIKDFIPKDKTLWCPFYCKGTQLKYLNELGFNDVIHKDEDFFKSYYPNTTIIDNPPYGKKFKDVCIRLKQLDLPFIIIGLSSVLLTKWFQELFKDHLQVILPHKRPTFSHKDNPKKGYTPPYGTMYYCYKMNFPRDLIYI
tara:strand:+ start:491 stop:970 length:480 start_codon:yes stop_codon:yes gene_type:complete